MNIQPSLSRLSPRSAEGVRRTAPPQFRLLLGLLCLVALPLQAQQDCLATLCQRFLSGNSSTGFVAFERYLVPSPALSRSHESPGPTYYAFLWNGPKFVLARAEDAPITNETSLATAAKFYGYDGEVYWGLSVNSVQTYGAVNGAPDLQDPISSASKLTVLSKEESAQARAGHKRSPSLSSGLLLAAEARRVAHLGFSFPLAQAPTLVSSNRLLLKDLDGRCQQAQFTGPRQRPATLEYSSSTNARGNFLVRLGFQTNTLFIDELSSRLRQPVSTTRYKVLAASGPPSGLAESMFSWQTYQPTTGGLIRNTPGEEGRAYNDK